MSFNPNFITLRLKGFSKIQKTLGLIGISILLYLFYLIVKKIRELTKIQTQNNKDEQLRTELLATKQIVLSLRTSPLTLTIDPNDKAQKEIFEKLVDLFVSEPSGIVSNISPEISTRFYKAFQIILDELEGGKGKDWNFEIREITRMTVGQYLLSVALKITNKK